MARTFSWNQQTLRSAAFEIALIFFGVTLAIAFGNWNANRVEKNQELAILDELRSDLEFNVSTLQSMLDDNIGSIAKIDSVIQHIEARAPRTDAFNRSLRRIQSWRSPYLSRGTYETLKAKGVDLIKDRSIRSQVIRLYENVYSLLISDQDRSEWVNYELSSIPQILKYVELLPDDRIRITDYTALIQDRGFLTAMYRTRAVRGSTNATTQDAIRETQAVADLIAEYLLSSTA